MASSKAPKDFGVSVVSRQYCAPVERAVFLLGQFSANATATPNIRIPVDRKMVIREAWVACSAIPSDPDGTMLLNMFVKDVSEGAADTLVSSADLESLVVAADKAYQLTLATETSELERTLEAGDVIYFTLVNNSAAIDTNPYVTVMVSYQAVEDV